MSKLEVIGIWIATAFFLAGAVLGWIALIWNKPRLLRWPLGLLAGGFAVLTFALAARWVRIGHGPYISAIEVLASSVWVGLAAMGLFAWRKPGIRAALGPALSVCVLLLGWAVLTDPSVMPLPPTFRSVWLIAHVLGAKLAFGSILIASGLSSAYLYRTRPAALLASKSDAEALAGNDLQSYRFVAFAFLLQLMPLFGP